MKWKQIIANGSDVTYRHGHRAIFDGENIFIYGGGNWRICKKLNGYNVKDNMFFLPKFGGKVSPGLACFGMAYVGNRIIIFGGMQEYGLYSNDLYVSFNTLRSSQVLINKQFYFTDIKHKVMDMEAALFSE